MEVDKVEFERRLRDVFGIDPADAGRIADHWWALREEFLRAVALGTYADCSEDFCRFLDYQEFGIDTPFIC